MKTLDFCFVEFEDLARFGFIQFQGPEADSTSKSSNISPTCVGGRVRTGTTHGPVSRAYRPLIQD